MTDNPDVQRLVNRARGVRHKPHLAIQRKALGGWITLENHDAHYRYFDACNWAIDALTKMPPSAELRVITTEYNIVLWPPEMAGHSIWKDT